MLAKLTSVSCPERWLFNSARNLHLAPSPVSSKQFCHKKARSWTWIVRGYILRMPMRTFYRNRMLIFLNHPCINNPSVFAFLNTNGFIEHKIQKGFLPKLSGTFEHTAQMANVRKNARIKQRSVVITLLDLKKAFGEVHNNLILEVLKYHHKPDHIQILISSLYSNFQTSIISNSFQAPFISVGRGVLQGDCLSPLTFNLCVNTFINYISAQKFNQFGFSIGSLSPVHWFQFADDAVITSLEKENQLLLNHFSRWCTWANMKIRVDKCSTFGIKRHLLHPFSTFLNLF